MGMVVGRVMRGKIWINPAALSPQEVVFYISLI